MAQDKKTVQESIQKQDQTSTQQARNTHFFPFVEPLTLESLGASTEKKIEQEANKKEVTEKEAPKEVLPKGWKKIQGDLERLKDPNSTEYVIFDLSDLARNLTPQSEESTNTLETKTEKENESKKKEEASKSKEDLLLCRIIIARVNEQHHKKESFELITSEGRPLAISFIFNYRPCPAEEMAIHANCPKLISLMQDYIANKQTKMDDRFNCYSAFGVDILSLPEHCHQSSRSFVLGDMRDYHKNYFFHVFQGLGLMTQEETQFIKKIFGSKILSPKELFSLSMIKEYLESKQFSKAIKQACTLHERCLEENASKFRTIFNASEDEAVPMNDADIAYRLGNYLEEIDPLLAIQAYKIMVNEPRTSLFYNQAQIRISALSLKLILNEPNRATKLILLKSILEIYSDLDLLDDIGGNHLSLVLQALEGYSGMDRKTVEDSLFASLQEMLMNPDDFEFVPQFYSAVFLAMANKIKALKSRTLTSQQSQDGLGSHEGLKTERKELLDSELYLLDSDLSLQETTKTEDEPNTKVDIKDAPLPKGWIHKQGDFAALKDPNSQEIVILDVEPDLQKRCLIPIKKSEKNSKKNAEYLLSKVIIYREKEMGWNDKTKTTFATGDMPLTIYFIFNYRPLGDGGYSNNLNMEDFLGNRQDFNNYTDKCSRVVLSGTYSCQYKAVLFGLMKEHMKQDLLHSFQAIQLLTKEEAEYIDAHFDSAPSSLAETKLWQEAQEFLKRKEYEAALNSVRAIHDLTRKENAEKGRTVYMDANADRFPFDDSNAAFELGCFLEAKGQYKLAMEAFQILTQFPEATYYYRDALSKLSDLQALAFKQDADEPTRIKILKDVFKTVGMNQNEDNSHQLALYCKLLEQYCGFECLGNQNRLFNQAAFNKLTPGTEHFYLPLIVMAKKIYEFQKQQLPSAPLAFSSAGVNAASMNGVQGSLGSLGSLDDEEDNGVENEEEIEMRYITSGLNKTVRGS